MYAYIKHEIFYNSEPCFKDDKYLLLNGVGGPYRKLGTEFFLLDLWSKCEACGPYIEGKTRESVTYSTDRENEVSKIFIISLLYV